MGCVVAVRRSASPCVRNSGGETMTHPLFTRLPALAVWVIACNCSVFAHEGDVRSKARTSEQCDSWVQQLANRSPRPFDRYVHDPPKEIDRKALNDVKIAY